MRYLAYMFCLLLLSPAAHAQDVSYTRPLIGDVSMRNIDIHASFNGASLLFFGAKNAPGDIVIVLRGPEAAATLRRKERVAGMWMMVEQARYAHMPAFYRVAATQRIPEIMSQEMADSLGIGKAAVLKEVTQNQIPNPAMDNALISQLTKRNWTDYTPTRVDFLGDNVFRSTMHLPGNLPRGRYIAEIFLIHEGQLISSQTLPISAEKQGIDAWLSREAQEASWFYGIASVVLALAGGWLGNRLLGR